MSDSLVLVLQGTPTSESTCYSVLADISRADAYEEAYFVTPFVTEQGVRMLTDIAKQAEVKRTHWIVGLDGIITTPAALQTIAHSLPTTSLRGWHQSPNHPTLHAKVYFLFRRSPPELVLYVGSSNATQGGLAENVEAGAFLVSERKNALQLVRRLREWLRQLTASPNCALLNERRLRRYAASYRRPQRAASRRLARVVGAERRAVPPHEPDGAYTWIEVAVRGGSSNQIEICKDMAPFFTTRKGADRVDFRLVDRSTGLMYSNNSYRFRSGNFGHRIEVNTELARALNLETAANRRDIVLFRRTRFPARYLVELHAAKAKATQNLIRSGKREGRVDLTTSGLGGRRFYI